MITLYWTTKMVVVETSGVIGELDVSFCEVMAKLKD